MDNQKYQCWFKEKGLCCAITIRSVGQCSQYDFYFKGDSTFDSFCIFMFYVNGKKSPLGVQFEGKFQKLRGIPLSLSLM